MGRWKIGNRPARVRKKTRAQEFGSKAVPVVEGKERKGNVPDETLIETLVAIYTAQGLNPEEARLRAEADVLNPLGSPQKERE